MSNDIEWKMVKLGDVCTMPTKTISSNTFETRFYVGTENMLQNCSGVIDNEISISTVRVREYKNDDILMSNIRPYLKKIWFSDKDAGCSTDVNIFRATDKCFPKYLFHVLCQDDFFNYVNDNAIGTKMPRGDKRIIPSFLIPIPYKNGAPDLETQKQIAQKLGDMDSLIAAKEKLLAKKRNLKVAAMQKLIKDEEGENWKKVKIGDYLRVKTGSKNTEDKIDDGKYPLYVRSPIVERINEYTHDCEAVLTAGDGVGTGKVFHYVNGKFAAHQRVYVISNFTEIDGKYFYYQFSQNFYDEVMKYTAKSSVDSVRRGMITGMEIALPFNSDGSPDLIEQQRIASILSDMDCEITAIEKEITKLQNLKTAMMQKMFCFGDSNSSSE